jgi:hypothetical protein
MFGIVFIVDSFTYISECDYKWRGGLVIIRILNTSMSHDYYECPLIAKSLKTDLELSPQPVQSSGLGLDGCSKRKHLEMIGHRKVDPRLAALRKLEELMRSSPEKYQGYLHKLWNLCENDQLII